MLSVAVLFFAEKLSIDEILSMQGACGLGDWIADEARKLGRL